MQRSTIIRSATAALLLGVITYAVCLAALSNIGHKNPGEPLNPCPVANAYGVQLASGLTFTDNSTGVGQFEVTEAQQDISSTQKLVSFNATGTTPLGTITWTGDPERTTTLSTVVSNNADGGYPATSDIYMHVNAEMSWLPGRVYRSRTEVHVRNTNLTSWDSHVNEVYNLVDPVEFEDAETGELAFTLNSLTSTIN